MFVLANTFPKSGTGLLRQMLSAVLPDLGHISQFDGGTGGAYDQESLERSISGLSKEHGFITAHLHYRPLLAEILKDCPVIFLVRDPRDVAVSHAHYVAREKSHMLYPYYQGLTWDEQLELSITGGGLMPDIGQRFLPFVPWLYGRVHVVNYEELQFSAPWLARLLGFPGKGDAIKAAIDPLKSPTFRQGKTGAWQVEMSPANLELFERVAGWLVELLKYEAAEVAAV